MSVFCGPHLLLVALESNELLLNNLLDVLNKRLFLVERIVIFYNGTWSDVEHLILADEVCLTNLVLEQSFYKKVAYSCVYQVFLLPLQVHEPLLRRHVEVQ